MTRPSLCPVGAFPPALVAIALILAFHPVVAAAGPRPVIFDTDICDDIDDTWALALLLQSPELDCKLVTTAVGNTEAKAKVVAKFLQRAGRTEIPVGVGVKQHDRSHRQIGWAQDYDLSSYPGTVYSDGVQAMIATIMNSAQRITVIAVGPLPNIGEALRREPAIAEKADFIGMHGSVFVGYGGKDKPDPEYNVVADAKAARMAFTAPWRVTITPLDTCGLVHLRGDKYQKLLERDSIITNSLLENYRIWHREGLRNRKDVDKGQIDRLVEQQLRSRSTTLFDTVAIYLAIDRGLVQMQRLPIRITDDGFTRVEEGAKGVDCAVKWTDLGAYEDWLVQRLTK